MMRRPDLAALAPRYDLVIVGGGITGAGIFREAARAGVSVLLVEARDYASGTSSWSSKLVHGGLRYLKSGDLRLTAESVRERQRLLAEAPDLVEPLAFLMPLHRNVKPGKNTMRMGLWLYDRLARGVRKSEFLAPADATALARSIRQADLLGAMHYQDARTDDCRLVWRLIAQGLLDGGTARNYTRVERLLTAGGGRVTGVAISDRETAASREIEATVVVNATGAWAADLGGQPVGAPKLRPLRGSHLIFPQASLPLDLAVSWLHPRDARPVFAYPWQGATLVGTTDLDHQGGLWDPRMSREECRYLLEALEWQFGSAAPRAEAASASFAGVRPIVDGGSGSPSAASRESALWSAPGLVGITGGKLTTFRVTARQVLSAVAKQLPRLALAADAAPLFTAATATAAVQSPSLGLACAHIGEQVVHLDDLLLRRSRIGLVHANADTEDWLPALAACRAQLGWDEACCAAELQRFSAMLAEQHSVPI